MCSGTHAQGTSPAENPCPHPAGTAGCNLSSPISREFLQNTDSKSKTKIRKTPTSLRADLAAGKGELAYLAVDNAVAMVELAHQDVVIVMGGEGSQNELMAQPDIKSSRDLRGKTLIVDAPNTAYALQMKKILLLNGLKPGRITRSSHLAPRPRGWLRCAENKDFAGSMLGPPTSLVAKHDGFVSLGSVQELIGPYQAAGFFTPARAGPRNTANLVIHFSRLASKPSAGCCSRQQAASH